MARINPELLKKWRVEKDLDNSTETQHEGTIAKPIVVNGDAEDYYNAFISRTWAYPDDVRLGVVGTAIEEWEHDSINTPNSKLKDTFICGLKECADLLAKEGGYQGAKTAKAIMEIIDKLSHTQDDGIIVNGQVADSLSSKSSSAYYGHDSQFAGKTLDDMDMKNGELEAYLAANKKSPMIKGRHGVDGKEDVYGVFEALEAADRAGKVIDQQKVLEILRSDKSSKERLQAALNVINGCE